jgi:hypothetical protein
MKLCDNTLSWDGLLCNLCRQLLDNHVVRIAHERNWCRTKMADETSTPFPANNSTGRFNSWWHDILSLRRCATRSCRLCELALSKIDDKAFGNLELWQATLPVTIANYREELSEFCVWMPETDPGPEAERSLNDEIYDEMILSMMIQSNPGKSSSTDVFIAANYVLWTTKRCAHTKYRVSRQLRTRHSGR